MCNKIYICKLLEVINLNYLKPNDRQYIQSKFNCSELLSTDNILHSNIL